MRDLGAMAETSLQAPALEADLERRFATFVADHFERARRLAWRMIGGDEAAAEDVAQEAFVKAYRGLGRFRGDASLATWFYRILVREAQSHRRWRSVRELWGGISDADAPDPGAPALGDPALRRRVLRALDRLSRSQRDVFVLVHEEGFTTREAAQLLGRSQGTVKIHLHRALQALRRDLGDLRKPTGGETR